MRLFETKVFLQYNTSKCLHFWILQKEKGFNHLETLLRQQFSYTLIKRKKTTQKLLQTWLMTNVTIVQRGEKKESYLILRLVRSKHHATLTAVS